MTYIAVNIADAVEPKSAPLGRYNLQITGCEEVVTGPNSKQPGSPMFKINIGFADNPEYLNFRHYIVLPDGSEENAGRLIGLRRFLELFKIPYSSDGIDTEKMASDMLGATANAEVQLGEPNDNGQAYNNLVTPRLRDADAAGHGKPPRSRR